MKMLVQVIGDVRMDPGILSDDAGTKPKAPGMKYRHYAPKAEMIIVEGKTENVIQKINRMSKDKLKAGKKVGIIGTDETVNYYEYGLVISIGGRQEDEKIAHNLYRILREFDESDVDIIFSESFSTLRMGQAIMNRLWKAAGHRVILAE